MRLKVITSAFFLALVLLLLASPMVFRAIPSRSAPKEQRRAYASQTLSYLGILVFAFAGAGIGSFFVYRQARKEYAEESIRNLKSLLEAPVKPAKEASTECQGNPDDGS